MLRSDDTLLYTKVARLVDGMITSGTLKPGDRVPSLRRLSRELDVSISTVSQAYVSLEEQGLIEARPQSGFFVTATRRSEPAPPRMTMPANQPRRVRLHEMVQTIFSSMHDPAIVPLGLANPGSELMPHKGLARAVKRVIARDMPKAASYGPLDGDPELRRLIAMRAASLGCEVSADDVVITNGATEALAVSLRAVAQPGDVIAVESPTYFSVLQLIESLGMLALEIPTDPAEGMCLDDLAERLDSNPVKALILIGNFSNPSGSLMSAENKQRLVAMLAKRAIPLIEDDINGDLYYGDSRPSIARCYDTQGLVLTCSSFSKTLAPGFRVGWVMPGGRFRNAVMNTKQVASQSTAALPQLAIAEFLRTGSYDRHLRRLRRAYQSQVERMRYVIADRFPEGTRITKPRGGIVLWIELPRGVDSVELFNRALENGVGITPGPLYSPTRKFKHYIRISCGTPWNEDTDRAIDVLAALVHEAA